MQSQPDVNALVRAQYAATITTAVASIVLCAITGWYAWLTHRLVEASQRQLAMLSRREAEERKSEAARLRHRAHRLREAVKRLPAKGSQPSYGGLIREGTLWSSEDLREAERLAGRLGPWVSGPLALVVQHLDWLAQRVEEINAVPPSRGFDYSNFPWDHWEKAWAESVSNLELLEKLAKKEEERQESIARDAA